MLTCAGSPPERAALAGKDEAGTQGFHQHGRVAAVAEAPAGGTIDGEGALMVAAMNGAYGPQPLPAFHDLHEIAERHMVDRFAA